MGNVLRIVIGLAGLYGAGWSALRVVRLRSSGQDAEAVVIETREVRRGGGQGPPTSHWQSTVQFHDSGGVERVAQMEGRRGVGTTVPIRYLPGRTEVVASPGRGSFGEAILILIVAASMIAMTYL